MDLQLEALRRDVRRLKVALVVCGVAIVALGGAHVLASRTAPTELAIGQVKIDQHGISISDPMAETTVRLRASAIEVSGADKGGVLLMPGEYVMNDGDARHFIRMQTSSHDGGGNATLQVGTNELTGPNSANTVSGFHVASSGDVAFTSLFSPKGEQFDVRSEPEPKAPSQEPLPTN